MIYELRQYTLAPGKQYDHIKANEERGRVARGDRYGKLMGYWVVEFGTLSRLVHLWEYEDLNQRAKLRAEMRSMPDWSQEYIPSVQVNLVSQKYDFLYPIVPLKSPDDTGNIYEMCWYKIRPGKANEFIELLQGIAPLREKFVRQVGLLRTEPSMLSEVVQLFAHQSLDERFSKSRQLEHEQEWQTFLQDSYPLLSEVTAVVLCPVRFSPMQ